MLIKSSENTVKDSMMQSMRDYPGTGAPLGVPLTWNGRDAMPEYTLLPTRNTGNPKADYERDLSTLNYALKQVRRERSREKLGLGRRVGGAVRGVVDTEPLP